MNTAVVKTDHRAPRLLDLSGYAFTGKQAVIDVIREFSGYTVPYFQFEFNLIRIQGGIRDLESALVDDWSPIRSDAALRRFRKLVTRLGTRSRWLQPTTWFQGCGWNYNDLFKGQFVRLSEEYINALTTYRWQTEWPYPMAEVSPVELFWRKLLRLCGSKTALDFDYHLSAPEDFVGLTRGYLRNLLAAFADSGVHTVVMHNSFEPFNPSRALRYFDDARCIVVDRDPRDSYVAQERYVPPNTNRRTAGPYRPVSVPPDVFVKRFLIYRKAAARYGDDGKRILRLQFEDLVTHYEKTLEIIYDFLGESRDAHVERGKYFQPAVSRKNVGIWKNFEDRHAIEIIKRELPQYCIIE